MPVSFRNIAPEFAAELAGLLRADDEPGLAEQLLSAQVVARCRCEDDFCASFYTAPPPRAAYGAGLDNIQLDPEVGMVILDIVDGRLMQVEVLYHDAFRRALHAAVP